MNGVNGNIDGAELDRFEAAASKWWDLSGEYAALHHINPVRVRYIERCLSGLAGKTVLDVGCGGGVLSEAMAARGAQVTGIDMGEASLAVARRHSRQSGLPVTYHRSTVEAFDAVPAGGYDAVTCMELLEHVPWPASVIDGCARLLKPGGHLVIATLNRTIRSWLLAIVMAERVLGIVSRGTHTWRQFVRPADIAAWGALAGLRVTAATGLRYLPYLNHAGLCRSMAVNYMMHLTTIKDTDPTMAFDRPKWFERGIRRQQLDDYIERTGKATFGFKEVSASEKESWVRRHFDTVAPYYDFMNTLCSLGIHHLWKRMAVNRLHLRPGGVVLDVCGGTGDLSILAAEKTGPAGTVVLFDINREMIQAGRASKSHRPERKRIHYVQGNAEAISLPDGACDGVMVGFGIRNVTRLRRAFSEMYRVLKPGGRFMCLEFSKPVNPVFRRLYDFHSFHVMPLMGQLLVGNREGYICLPETIRLFSLPDELAALLIDVGFTDVAYRRLTNGIAVIHTGRKPV